MDMKYLSGKKPWQDKLSVLENLKIFIRCLREIPESKYFQLLNFKILNGPSQSLTISCEESKFFQTKTLILYCYILSTKLKIENGSGSTEWKAKLIPKEKISFWVLKELANMIVKKLFIIFEKSWL